METAIYTAFDGYSHFDEAEAERNLMRAIIQTIMDDMRKEGEPRRNAMRYIRDNEEDYLFSFISICRHLNLCPRTIRTILCVQ